MQLLNSFLLLFVHSSARSIEIALPAVPAPATAVAVQTNAAEDTTPRRKAPRVDTLLPLRGRLSFSNSLLGPEFMTTRVFDGAASVSQLRHVNVRHLTNHGEAVLVRLGDEIVTIL